MFRSLLVPFLFGASAVADAQSLTFADVKAKNATQLGADDPRTLMPETKVVSRTPQAAPVPGKTSPTELSRRRRMVADPAEREIVIPPPPAPGESKITERYA